MITYVKIHFRVGTYSTMPKGPSFMKLANIEARFNIEKSSIRSSHQMPSPYHFQILHSAPIQGKKKIIVSLETFHIQKSSK